jgi:hypothetical protein
VAAVPARTARRLEPATHHERTKGRKIARLSHRLNPGELKTLGDSEHCDGGGLYLIVNGSSRRSWIVK